MMPIDNGCVSNVEWCSVSVHGDGDGALLRRCSSMSCCAGCGRDCK